MKKYIQQFFGLHTVVYKVLKKRVRRKKISSSTKIYLKYKEDARRRVNDRLVHFNTVYGYSYGKVCIKNQKTRWGSCSSKRNLNFNYKIIFLPEHLVDYIIVHELCHLEEFNHGKRFWDLVARTIPHHELCRNELRAHEKTIHLRDHVSMLP